MSDEEKCWSCKSFEPSTGLEHMVGVGWQCRDSAACRMTAERHYVHHTATGSAGER